MSAAPGWMLWWGLGAALAVWVAATFVARRRLPTIVDVVHFFLDSWAGRLAMLACWAVAGFHVLTQRP